MRSGRETGFHGIAGCYKAGKAGSNTAHPAQSKDFCFIKHAQSLKKDLFLFLTLPVKPARLYPIKQTCVDGEKAFPVPAQESRRVVQGGADRFASLAPEHPY